MSTLPSHSQAPSPSPPQPCCLKAFPWDATPSGHVETITITIPSPGGGTSIKSHNNFDTYITTGSKSSDNDHGKGKEDHEHTITENAILLIPDLLGYSFPNTRLLADRYAECTSSTVYVPDFFHGDTLPAEPINQGRWHEIADQLAGFMERNSRDVREGEILEFARFLRSSNSNNSKSQSSSSSYRKVAAVGFCYGGWAAFRLGGSGGIVHENQGQDQGQDEKQQRLVDCIVVGHPSLLTRSDIEDVGVPTQILAPEIDPVFTDELKMYAFETMVKNRNKDKPGVMFDYVHFPAVEHGCLVRGDPGRKGEREAMTKGMDAAVTWLKGFLLDGEGGK